MNYFNKALGCLFLVLFFAFPFYITRGMDSENYSIDKDSINFGGTEDSESENYQISDTLGEIGTGETQESCSSLDFNGTSDYVTLGDLDAVDGITELTVTAWIKIDDTNIDGDIAAKGTHSTNQPFLFWRDELVGSGPQLGNTNCISVLVYDGDTQAWSSSPSGTLDDTDWHHVAFTFEADTSAGLKTYVDGVNANSTDTTNVNFIQSSTNALIFAAATVSSVYLDGKMDDIRIYSRVLNSTEINNLYQERYVSESGLIGKWYFNEGEGATAYDSSGNGNNGTIVGASFVNYSASTCQILNAGYRQLDETYISISSPSNVTMTPAIAGITGGTGNGSAIWTVVTDNPAGYQISIRSSTSPALQSGSYSFANYSESVAGTPDYNWSVATTDSEFGYTVEGDYVVSKFLDTGAICGSGSSNSVDACWYGFLISDETIVSSFLPNHPAGKETTVKFRAESGASHFQAEGSYSATIVTTAVSL